MFIYFFTRHHESECPADFCSLFSLALKPDFPLPAGIFFCQFVNSLIDPLITTAGKWYVIFYHLTPAVNKGSFYLTKCDVIFGSRFKADVIPLKEMLVQNGYIEHVQICRCGCCSNKTRIAITIELEIIH